MQLICVYLVLLPWVTRQDLCCSEHIETVTSTTADMFSDSFAGSVPAYYREVYEILCPHNEQVDKDLFIQLLLKSSLPRPTISQVNIYFIIHFMIILRSSDKFWDYASKSLLRVGGSQNGCTRFFLRNMSQPITNENLNLISSFI